MSGEGEQKETKTGQKRHRLENNSSPEAERIFQKSKIVVRTPTKIQTEASEENLDMEDIKRMLEDLKNDIKNDMREIHAGIREDIKAIRDDLRDMKSEIKENKVEIHQTKEEIQKMKNDWAKEKEELITNVQNVLNKTEKIMKEKIRNNLVITGIDIDTNDNETLTIATEKMIEQELKVKVKVNKAYKIGQQRCIIELQNFEDKIATLKAKRNLKGKNIFIESELTENERKIQKELRDIARNEKSNGATVKIRYQKLEINGITMKWDKKEQKLVEDRNKAENSSISHPKN
jgi:hypothetical protein